MHLEGRLVRRRGRERDWVEEAVEAEASLELDVGGGGGVVLYAQPPGDLQTMFKPGSNRIRFRLRKEKHRGAFGVCVN